ncbi:RAP protein, putative [Plasmodium gallinaceum]|uniref:RAP protein, putative n=1 Tax=Plasmodium gallinaceum TaxID=5849 RepID=A0A1J1GZR0_PLAGA|nr:RAP protein, putative [Plasmodium gallinaceum]CRG97938.1 RAP protein, putative [Plasmodium gallinaceum]
MKRFVIRGINSNIFSFNIYLKKCNFYSNKKNVQNNIELRTEYLCNENYEDVEYDENIPSNITFDINVDDKWREKEEIEYKDFLKKTKCNLNKSTFNIETLANDNCKTFNRNLNVHNEKFFKENYIKNDNINHDHKYFDENVEFTQESKNNENFIQSENGLDETYYDNRINFEENLKDSSKNLCVSNMNSKIYGDDIKKNFSSDKSDEMINVEYIKNLINKKEKSISLFLYILDILKKNNDIIHEIEEEYINKLFKILYENFENASHDNLICILSLLNELNMKNKIRDISYDIIKLLNKEKNNSLDNEEKIKLCIHYITIMNNFSLYFVEFYDYLIVKVKYMNCDQLTEFANQCFKHSLRTKHYLDKIVIICMEKLNMFNLNQIKSLYYSFHRFCKEYSNFYDLSLNIIIKNIDKFDLTFYHLILKISNNFKHDEKYINLISLAAKQITLNIQNIRNDIRKSSMKGNLINKEKKREEICDYSSEVKNVDDNINVEEAYENMNEEIIKSKKARKINQKNGKVKEEHDVNENNKEEKEKKEYYTEKRKEILNNTSKNQLKDDFKLEDTICDDDKKSEIIKIIHCLKYFEYNKKNDNEVKNVVNNIYELINENIEYIKYLDVEDVVYSIVCFCSYNKRIILYNNLLDILCEKSNELIHAKNISLWIYPLISLSKISWFHMNYMVNMFKFIEDTYVLSRLSVFQLLKLLSSIVKMNIYDEKIYKILIEKLFKEWDVIKKKIIDISTFLWSCAYVNIIYKPLFDESYKLIIDLLNKESFDVNNAIYKNCFVNITWSFIVANYHKTQENFDKILNMTFLNRDPHDSQAFKRLHQIADSCFKEIPRSLIDLKCLDIMYKYCMHEKCKILRNDFNIYKKEKDAMKIRNKILDELVYILKNFNISYNLHFEPYHNSPYIIDIVLNQQMQIGICVFSKEHLMRTLKKSSWDFLNTGFVSLQIRILYAHGWKIIPINAGEWLQLNYDKKKTFLYEYFKQHSIQI